MTMLNIADNKPGSLSSPRTNNPDRSDWSRHHRSRHVHTTETIKRSSGMAPLGLSYTASSSRGVNSERLCLNITAKPTDSQTTTQLFINPVAAQMSQWGAPDRVALLSGQLSEVLRQIPKNTPLPFDHVAARLGTLPYEASGMDQAGHADHLEYCFSRTVSRPVKIHDQVSTARTAAVKKSPHPQPHHLPEPRRKPPIPQEKLSHHPHLIAQREAVKRASRPLDLSLDFLHPTLPHQDAPAPSISPRDRALLSAYVNRCMQVLKRQLESDEMPGGNYDLQLRYRVFPSGSVLPGEVSIVSSSGNGEVDRRAREALIRASASFGPAPDAIPAGGQIVSPKIHFIHD